VPAVTEPTVKPSPPAAAAAPTGLSARQLLALAGFFVLLRLALSMLAEPIVDEAYYWLYAQHMELAFLDHPPLVAWLDWLGTALLGDTPAGLRLGAIACGLIALGYVYRLTRAVGGDHRQALAAVLLGCALPAFFLSGLLMTPDAPLVAAWAAGLYYLQRALVAGEGRAWLGVGLAFGVGLLAKYPIVLLAAAAAGFPHPYLAVLLALALFSPVLVWNAQHEWASFAFQGSRRLQQEFEFSTHLLVGHVLVLLFPTGALAAWGIASRPAWRAQAVTEARSRRLLLWSAAVPFGVFLVFSLFNYPHFHWTGPAYVGLLPLLAATLVVPAAPGDRLRRLLDRLWRPTVYLLAAGYAVAAVYIVFGLPGVPYPTRNVAYLAWQPAARAVHALEQQIERDTGQRPLVVGMSKWSIAAGLAFHDVDGRRDNITSRNLYGRTGAMFEYWFDDDSGGQRPVLLVDFERKDLEDPRLDTALVNVGPVREQVIHWRGQVARHLYYRVAAGYRPDAVRRIRQER
jgi:dolichol-phosphate mannosyltransferase